MSIRKGVCPSQPHTRTLFAYKIRKPANAQELVKSRQSPNDLKSAQTDSLEVERQTGS